MENAVNLSLRTNPQLLGLLEEGQEYQPTINRIDFFNQAIEKSLSDCVDWKRLSKDIINYPNRGSIGPEYIQLRVDKKQWDDVVNEIKESFSPPLKRVKASYAVKLILYHYISFLSSIQTDKHTDEIDIKVSEIEEMNFELPEIVKSLAEILIQEDCPEKMEIYKIITKWRNKV